MVKAESTNEISFKFQNDEFKIKKDFNKYTFNNKEGEISKKEELTGSDESYIKIFKIEDYTIIYKNETIPRIYIYWYMKDGRLRLWGISEKKFISTTTEKIFQLDNSGIEKINNSSILNDEQKTVFKSYTN